MSVPSSQTGSTSANRSSSHSLFTLPGPTGAIASSPSASSDPSQVHQSQVGTMNILKKRDYEQIQNFFGRTWNVIVTLAALAAAYAAFKIALWTAMKDYRDDCREQYELFRNLSSSCGRALSVELPPPIGLDMVIGNGRKRSVSENQPHVDDIILRSRGFSTRITSWLAYLCLVVTIVESVLRTRVFVMVLLRRVLDAYPSSRSDDFGPYRELCPGCYERAVSTSVIDLPAIPPASSLTPPLPRDILVYGLEQRTIRLTESATGWSNAKDSTEASYQDNAATNHNRTLQFPTSVPAADLNIEPQSIRRRGNLPKPVTDVLRTWFTEHLDHPYPSEEDKQMFIEKTGLTISQISNWFINARRRHWPAIRGARGKATTTAFDDRITTLQF